MATHAPITGAPTRARSKQDLSVLDDAICILEALEGALGVLAAYLDDIPNVGSNAPRTAHACSYMAAFAREMVSSGQDLALAYLREAK